MSKVEEIEQAAEQLPLADFIKLAAWIDQRRQQIEIPGGAFTRNHSAFLSSYAAEDEGLYDNATAG